MVTDTELESPVAINGGTSKDIVSGFPTFNETDRIATTRAFIGSTEANGFSLAEVGTFNTDGTAKMHTHDVFTAISKGTSDQIAFIIKDEVV